MVQFKAEKEFRLEDIRAALVRGNLSDYELQDVPHDRILIIRTQKPPQSGGSVGDQVAALLSREFPNNYFVMLKVGLHYQEMRNFAASRPWLERSMRLEWPDNPAAIIHYDLANARLLEAATNQLWTIPTPR